MGPEESCTPDEDCKGEEEARRGGQRLKLRRSPAPALDPPLGFLFSVYAGTVGLDRNERDTWATHDKQRNGQWTRDDDHDNSGELR